MVKHVEQRHSTDGMVRNLALSLVRDFQTTFDDPGFCSDFQQALLSGDIARIRDAVPTVDELDDVARYKATYQVQSIFKRYRFETDIYSDDELKDKAIESFMYTQNRIRDLNFDQLDAFTSRVIEHARTYIAKVLGKYSDEEHRNLCRFGRRASVGIPARTACEAARWELPISGSQEQISWFDSEMSQIDAVQEYWASLKGSDPQRSTYCETSSLALTLVPKTFKSLRVIMPNTTIGSYMSYGLGEMIRKRLKRKGYDISKLQMQHRVLACQASRYNCYVTADLSSASDSISVRLVELLFPTDWLDVLNQSRIGNVTLPDGSVIQSNTFCTMGIGYTFPLQTLVFLSLLKAIEATLYNRWNRRTVSVYGDDLIYSSPMHQSVVRTFEQLGFVFNLDKTFHEGGFRESCGGDYYHGVDVRPFQPRNGSAYVGDKAYEAMLYKYVNGLLTRWSEHEIVRALRFLTSEIEDLVHKVKIVPDLYPDDSGIVCPTLTYWDFLQNVKVAKPKHIGHGVFRFSFLRFTPNEREEKRHVPYFWLALRGLDPYVDDYFVERRIHPPAILDTTARRIDELTGVSEDVESFIRREIRPIKTFRSETTGRRLRRESTYLTVSHTGRYKRWSGTSCFEVRR